MKSLAELHNARSGKVSDKWSSYFEHYEKLFGGIRLEPVSMIEIGVQNGGSLETWSEYFPNAKRIVGIDIDPKCRSLRYTDKRVEVVVGDCNSGETVQSVLEILPEFDILIDDGSHTPYDIVKTFFTYFPKLKLGGFYIVEDCHTLYMNAFGAGLRNGSTARDFYKALWDVANAEFWDLDISSADFLEPYAKAVNLEGSGAAIGYSVRSVYLANSFICVSKDSTNSKGKLGERLVKGTDKSVHDWTALKD